MKRQEIKKMNRRFFKENAPLLCGMAVTAAGVTAAGLLLHQSFFRILPLYVSLAVGLLQSRMIRYASLLGGLNSILYALVYAHYHLYASAAYALLVSCPIQIVTFIRWSRKPWGHSTVFRVLTVKQRIAAGAVFAGLLAGLGFALPYLGGEHTFLDSAVTLLGILTSVLMMLSYKEYPLLMVVGGVLSSALYISMLPEHPEQATYLIFNLYSLVCCTLASVRIRKLYAEQQQKQASGTLP